MRTSSNTAPDLLRHAAQAGSDREGAVLEAVSVRFRPVMMTTFSTVAGMIPLAVEWSLGAERFSRVVRILGRERSPAKL
jgi:multidrug efflux pump subunit AcrB